MWKVLSRPLTLMCTCVAFLSCDAWAVEPLPDAAHVVAQLRELAYSKIAPFEVRTRAYNTERVRPTLDGQYQVIPQNELVEALYSETLFRSDLRSRFCFIPRKVPMLRRDYGFDGTLVLHRTATDEIGRAIRTQPGSELDERRDQGLRLCVLSCAFPSIEVEFQGGDKPLIVSRAVDEVGHELTSVTGKWSVQGWETIGSRRLLVLTYSFVLWDGDFNDPSNCTVIPGSEKLLVKRWLDPDRGWLPVITENLSAGKLFERSEISGTTVVGGVQFPVAGRRMRYLSGTEVVASTWRYEAEPGSVKVSNQYSNADYLPPLKIGDVVEDELSGRQKMVIRDIDSNIDANVDSLKDLGEIIRFNADD